MKARLQQSLGMLHHMLTGLSLVVVGACSDIPVVAPDLTPGGPPLLSLGTALSTPQGAALSEITRAVALALANPGLRHQVRDDLRESRHTVEHKLDLRSYLKGKRGGLLLAQMARATGASRDSITALLDAVRPLEFYMPVPSHRSTWAAGENLLLVSQLTEESLATGFDLEGRSVPIDLALAPSTPTLSLVPVETDFTKPLDSKRFKNAHDNSGTTIGTFMVEDPCIDPTAPGCTGGTNPPAGVTPDAVYLTESHVFDAHEPWLKGSPELEMHVHGPQNKDFPRYGEDLTCSGADVGAPNYYDQNGNDWAAPIGGGAPLLMSRFDINEFQSKFPFEAVHYVMWEDDNGACKTQIDYNFRTVLLQAAGAGIGAGIVAMKITSAGAGAGFGVGLAAAAVTFVIDILKNSASLLYGNDDLVGVLIDLRGTAEASSYPGQTHKVMTGGTFNGTTRLEFVWATLANGRSVASQLSPSNTSMAMDQVGTAWLSAAVTDQHGAVMSSHPRHWRSSNTAVARIDDNGFLRGVGPGNTSVLVRACDPECMDRLVDVAITGPTLTGPDYVVDDMAYLSAQVVNPRQGSYYYRWEHSECSTTTCSGYWSPLNAGWDVTSGAVWVNRNVYSYNVRVTILTSDYGNVVGTVSFGVAGAGQSGPCDDPSQLDCSGPAMSRSGMSSTLLRAEQVTARPTPNGMKVRR